MRYDDTNKELKLLTAERKSFLSGGEKRIQWMLPPLIFQAYELVYRIHTKTDYRVSSPLLWFWLEVLSLEVDVWKFCSDCKRERDGVCVNDRESEWETKDEVRKSQEG